ncbi:MAG: penicillin-binding protein 2 [Candidatus Shapirobacteria bacterium]|nr:penicillin-binding protein 2 [Candidatus Shapirobacteria bacterium]
MNPPRIKTISIVLTSCFILILTRFFYIQIIKGPELREKALTQTYKLIKTIPSRGKIFSSDNFPLVLNITSYQLSIYKPNLKDDLTKIIDKINQVYPKFNEENNNLIENLKNNSNQKWMTFTSLFDENEKNQLNIPGLTFQKIEKRYYPEFSMASPILGLVAKNQQGYDIGYGGLEGYYQKQLQGKTGFTWSPQDATGKAILTKKSWNSIAVDGQNIFTTLNRSIQYLIETELKNGVEKYDADSGAITIMNSQTGGILAMANFTATSSATPSATKISPISDLFEPGSIFKPIVVTMALDSKSISLDYICDQCDKPLTIGQYTITNYDNSTHPNSSLKDIIKNSDNIGMSHIISKLGLSNFLDYYQKLGLNQKTAIDLQGESKPNIKTNWPDIDLATASFGQGIVVSQISMLQAFNTIANNGILVKPHLLINKSNNSEKVFNSDSTNQMKSILKYAVENGVIANMKPKDIEVCAKSGTAQIAIKGGYTDSSTIASYIGFSPCDNPKFTMIVTINNPKSSPWGSSTAAPIWFDLASKINYLL